MNTHESYVSLETAKLLKEAGFDWECEEYREKIYIPINSKDLPTLPLPYNLSCKVIEDANEKSFEIRKYPRPTLEVAQRWLREKNLLLYIPPCHIDKKWVWRYWITNCINKEDTTQIYSVKEYDTYEEAQEAGVKTALKLILEK